MWKTRLFQVLKIVLPLLVIAWLLSQLDQKQLEQLRDQPKNYGLLAAAFVLVLSSISLTFIRWRLLVCALGLSFRWRDAFRLGFLGYFFNFVAAGGVGGDLFKAIFIAREQPQRRAAAVASVMMDRLMGLYALLVLASLVILLNPAPEGLAEVQTIRQMTLWGAGVVTVIIFSGLFLPFPSEQRLQRIADIPKVGGTLLSLISAFRQYRDKPHIVLFSAAMGLAVHGLLAAGVFLSAYALYADQAPSLQEHLVIVPLTMVIGALPFTPAGLGVMEFAMDSFYKSLAGRAGQGVIVALVYRLMTIAAAVVGLCYYWVSRRELEKMMQQEKEKAESSSSESEYPPEAQVEAG